MTIAQRIEAGLVLTPEDRQRDGLVQTMTVGQNLSLASIGAFTRRLLTSKADEQEIIERSIREVTIKTDGGGTGDLKVDYTVPPAGGDHHDPGVWNPGGTWYCQAWYRDPAGGGAFHNFTDGLNYGEFLLGPPGVVCVVCVCVCVCA